MIDMVWLDLFWIHIVLLGTEVQHMSYCFCFFLEPRGPEFKTNVFRR